LFADPDAELRDVVTRASLERVLTHYRESGWRADRVVATGDLIQDDSFEAYERFRELMLPLNLRVHCVPGNHDVRDLMKKACCVPPFSYCAYEEVRNWLIVGIDSCLDDESEGDAGGEVSGEELDRLEGVVADSTAPHVMVCLHHPPVLIGSKGLDSVGLRNRSEVVDRLRALARVRVVALGGRMIRILALLAAVVMAWPAWADGDGHPVTMWRVDGRTNTIYLLGSIHLLRAEDHPLPSVIGSAYDEAEVLVMELDMDDLDPAQTQQAFNAAGVMRDGTTLRDLMGDELYARAEAAAARIDVPLEMLAQSEPWLAAMTVELMMLYRIGFQPSLGVEMTMLHRATADGKPIEGLETVEEQLAFLDGLSLPAQREMLLRTLEESARIGEMVDELIEAWRHGDADTLAASLLDSLGTQAELHEALVTGRNRRWAQEIRGWLDDEQDYLVVVGALHLVGEDSVPALLAGQGIGIHQLSEPARLR
jgi:uncharacterized protein YbaP (TraB family)